MPLLIKRNPDGRLMARHEPGPELFLLGRSRRVASRKSFDVRHYMIPSAGTIVFAFKGLSMSMLHDPARCQTNEFGNNLQRSAGAAKDIYYEGRSYLIFPDTQTSRPYLVNEAGLVMAGSNTFDNGSLCLGTTIDPTNFSAVDALCFNAANRDLAWEGMPLIGAWERNPDPERPRARASAQIFKVTTWPTWTPRNFNITPIPPQILADLAACWPS